MKMLIFLVALLAVVSVVVWRVRKADAERDLARTKVLKQKQKQRQEAIRPEEHLEWPTIIRAAGKQTEETEEELPEPTMTAIKFKPVDRPGAQH